MLATSPFEPAAKVLKARALVGLNRQDEAVDLLSEQVRSQPTDSGSLALLAKIYERRNDWQKVLEVARRLNELAPADQRHALLLIEAALRTGDIASARSTSLRILQPKAEASLVASVLELWANFWPSPQRLKDARALANAAPDQEQKLIYAAFLSRAGSPIDAIRIAGSAASLPVRAENAEANAVLADALSRTGNIAAAKARFDAVVGFDPGNATALRGRTEIELRTGNSAGAVIDAQKLVTVLPNSTRDRLLLARAFSAAGNARWAERTLWAAFQDIPGDEQIFAALRAGRNGNAEATNELQAEFARQRDAKLNRGLL